MSVLRHTKIAALQAPSVVRVPEAATTDHIGSVPFWPALRHVKEYNLEDDQDYFRLDTRFNGRVYSVNLDGDLSAGRRARRVLAVSALASRMQEDYGVRPRFTVK